MKTVVEFPDFSKQAEDLFTVDQLNELRTHLALNPLAGDIIPGSGGVRKLRWEAKGKGKRGGARVITYFHVSGDEVLVLAAYAKNTQVTLSKSHIAMLRQLVKALE
ncbi:MAG: addiction module toxin RelE [Rickettsiales bacterium]|nr:addiction module toxin RelE [Rickettsiales bacterium]|tara:strand:+ start:961 stop:1278 length:318 start_codon:yes stop_codon:yes gene_type:complete